MAAAASTGRWSNPALYEIEVHAEGRSSSLTKTEFFIYQVPMGTYARPRTGICVVLSEITYRSERRRRSDFSGNSLHERYSFIEEHDSIYEVIAKIEQFLQKMRTFNDEKQGQFWGTLKRTFCLKTIEESITAMEKPPLPSEVKSDDEVKSNEGYVPNLSWLFSGMWRKKES